MDVALQESEEGELIVSNTCRLTASQLVKLLRMSLDKYKRALVEPGEASPPLPYSKYLIVVLPFYKYL